MNISGYGVASNYSGYGVLSNKSKTSSDFIIPNEKPKTESKNNNSNSTNKVYNPFEDIAKTGSVNLPSWIYTKTEPTRSDEDILKDVEELAKKHAEQGTFFSQDDEYLSLMKEYISSVSPDRKSILENTVNEINENVNKIPKPQKNVEEKDFDMIDTLLQILQKIQKGEDKKISNRDEATSSSNGQFICNMSGATYDAYVEGGEVKAALMYSSSGEVVMDFGDRNIPGQLSVTQYCTDEENARSAELVEVYRDIYRKVSDSKGIISGNAFDTVC
jgi:hypothetical protein